MIPNAAIAMLAALLVATGCGSSNDAAKAPKASSDASSAPAGQQVSAAVTVVMENVLGQNCEALSGNFSALHNGAVVTLEDAASHEVGRGRLGKATTQPPKGLCAWSTTIDAELPSKGTYRAVVGNRWTSKAVSPDFFATGSLVIDAK